MRTGQAVKMDRSAGKLSDLEAIAIKPSAPAQPTREVPNMLVPPRLQNVPNVDAPDTHGALSPIVGQAPAADLSFGGYDSDDNATLFGFRIMPPDTNGDVGLTHYVQWNNLGFKIFDKAGNLLNGPNGSPGNLPWAGFGGTCETENDGDPVVLYDHVAGRWLFSQFEIGPGLQCVAITDGEDPAGPYTRYAFAISIAGFNDYPKIGLWVSADGTQSAYHVTTNEFSPFRGVNLTALDRDGILAANPAAGFVQFTIPPAAGSDPFAFSLQAGHLEGPVLPPAGTCETYIQAFDSETWGAGGGTDGYRTWNFCVDFDTPANSSLNENALIPAGFEFDSNLCGFGACVPQPNGQSLDTLSQFTMFRFAVREVGGSFSGVVSHSVDLGGNLAGVQWAQFDMSGAAPTLSDIGQLNVGDGFHRWMPSISQDQDGNIAIGYSRSGSGPSDFPSVYYTGRLASDPAGSLQAEALCVAGTGSQEGAAARWGDYSSVSVDPSDDCTFWVTNEYVQTTGSFQWDTQVCTFSFPGCGDSPPECTRDADCDDGAWCNGNEVCNAGSCQAGTPVVCDDGLFCNGTDTCNEAADSCDTGAPPDPDDGVSCTDDSCNEATDSIDNVPNNSLCDNGQFCDGSEVCDPVNDCQAGSDPCPGGGCDEVDDVCLGCGDGTCDPGEDCNSCPSDCISGELPGAVCGNGLCEAGNGENGVNCAADCNGRLNGKPSNRFSCGFDTGDGYAPDGCGDSRCTTGDYQCTEIPVNPVNYCCGDLTCEGVEDSFSCEVDCGPAPFCGDDICDPGEDQCSCAADCGSPPGSETNLCDDGIDNDCNGDIDCSDLAWRQGSFDPDAIHGRSPPGLRLFSPFCAEPGARTVLPGRNSWHSSRVFV
jgi:hypothetical protein